MSIRTRRILLVGGVVVVLLTVWLLLERNCPSAGIALTRRARDLHRLKNRTAFPQAADFDSRVTLEAVLQRGHDSNRWSTDRAARLQGYVIDVAYARPEATNCFSPCRRDIHILIAKHKDAPKSEQVVLEVTPRLRDWATAQGYEDHGYAMKGTRSAEYVSRKDAEATQSTKTFLGSFASLREILFSL